MTKLETYLHNLDHSDFDFHDENRIKGELETIAKQLKDEGKDKNAELALLNSLVFSIRKSFRYTDNREEGQIKGLSYTFRAQKTLEDGTVEPLFWPDVTKLTDDDFRYFEGRYKEAVNLYVKTEYGLLVYFGSKTTYSKHNLEFKGPLFDQLFELNKSYLKKKDDDFRYAQHSNLSLELAWGIAKESNLQDKIKKLAGYLSDVVLQSDVTNETDLWVLVAYSNLLADNYDDAKTIVDFKPVIEKVFEAAKEKEKNDLQGALFIADLCVRLAKKGLSDKSLYLAYKAGLYEKMAIQAESHNGMAVVHFAEKALLLYKELNLTADIKRLEAYYSRMRGEIEMYEFHREFPDEYVKELQKQIKDTVAKSNEEEILSYFISTPWYRTTTEISELADKVKSQSILQTLTPVKVMDKFGNTVAEYITEAEREEFRFWETYGLHFQPGSQTMHRFFIEAYKEGKLSYDSVTAYLKTTWLNEPMDRNYTGNEIAVKPIDTLRPGLKRIFDELKLFDADNSHHYDTITIIDSLTLKIEGLLRFFCERIEIPTFKLRRKGDSKVFMEKLLDDLLADITHKPKWNPNHITGFDEEDRIMLKFVLTEKAGFNLRNKVAHGLMDNFEYNFQLVVILFSLILKLSKYSFTEIKGEENESNSK